MTCSPESIDLDNSIPFDVYKLSKYPEVRGLNNYLYNVLIDSGLYARQPNARGQTRIKGHLRTITLNLYHAYLLDNSLYVGYSRAENNYNQGSRYNKLFISYSILIRAIDKLVELKYIEHHIGFRYRNTGIGRQSRIRATKKLIRLIQQHHLQPKMIQRDSSKEEIIILKDCDGRRKEYEDTLDTHRMRKNLRRINAVLNDAFVGLCISDEYLVKFKYQQIAENQHRNLQISNKRLRRIFNNGNFDEGGRFYGGWWQNISKKYRKFIVIGNPNDSAFNPLEIHKQRVVEIDYKAHHARMLYRKIGIDLRTKDPFIFSDFSPSTRGLFKQAFYTMLNASSRRQAKGVIYHELKNNLKPEYSGLSADCVLRTIEGQRQRISKYFYKGIGLKLQNLDSQIAERIMLEMLDKGCLALTMHDSFIVNEYHENALRESMRNAFEEFVGVRCKTSKKQNSDQWKEHNPGEYRRLFKNGEFLSFNQNFAEWLAESNLGKDVAAIS